MRISDWSSDVCSSDLESIAPMGRSHGLVGGAGGVRLYGQTFGGAPRSGCFIRPMQNRWQVGASMIHQRLRNSLFLAPSASRRAASESRSNRTSFVEVKGLQDRVGLGGRGFIKN